MVRVRIMLTRALSLFVVMITLASAAHSFPEIAQLPARKGLPDPLTMESGRRVATRAQWTRERAPELRRLFAHYEYGEMPAKPARFEAKILRTDPAAFGGKATLKEVEVRCAKPDALVHLLVVVPNGRRRPAPCFLGLNFHGNYTIVADPLVAMPKGWVNSARIGGAVDHATEAMRGKQIDAWAIEQTITRGYAVATFFNGEVVPDNVELATERLKSFVPAGKVATDCDAPATIAAWAWGFSRMLDYLVTDPDIDAKRVAVVGHSRNGKAALLAAAMDNRIALAIPSQSGCGGTAPCRVAPELAAPQTDGRPIAETVAAITTSFPHWFCANFLALGATIEKLPIDQHELIALCAPRPVLVSCAVEDRWSNPEGQLAMLKAAAPVYKLVCGEEIHAKTTPPTGQLAAGRLGYFIRPGVHSMTAVDWAAWLDYTDRWMK